MEWEIQKTVFVLIYFVCLATCYGQLRMCIEHDIIFDLTRSPSPSDETSYDHSINSKWYRLKAPNEAKLPSHCIPQNHCGTQAPGWLNGDHPRIKDGVVQRNVCFHHKNNCCQYNTTIQIRKCYGGYYVYKLKGVSKTVPGRYCVDTDMEVEYPKDKSTFEAVRSEYALVNHTIYVESKVKDAIHCMTYCQMTKGCVSYNYNPKNEDCELNNSVKRKHPLDFQKKANSVYYEKSVVLALKCGE